MRRTRIIPGDLDGSGVEGRREKAGAAVPGRDPMPPADGDERPAPPKKPEKKNSNRIVDIKGSDADIFGSYKY
jgi:hypothetical protein